MNVADTILHEVVKYGRSATLKQLMAYQPNTELKNNSGFTPMMVAQYRISSGMIKTLLDDGVLEQSAFNLSPGMSMRPISRHAKRSLSIFWRRGSTPTMPRWRSSRKSSPTRRLS